VLERSGNMVKAADLAGGAVRMDRLYGDTDLTFADNASGKSLRNLGSRSMSKEE